MVLVKWRHVAADGLNDTKNVTSVLVHQYIHGLWLQCWFSIAHISVIKSHLSDNKAKKNVRSSSRHSELKQKFIVLPSTIDNIEESKSTFSCLQHICG